MRISKTISVFDAKIRLEKQDEFRQGDAGDDPRMQTLCSLHHGAAMPYTTSLVNARTQMNAQPSEAGATIGVRGIEVVQVIQAIDNRVRLIAGKPTVVRVYLDPAAIAAPTLVTGEMT